MTRDEFLSQVGTYVSKLWPRLVLNTEQTEIWFHKLKAHTTYDVRKVLGEAYAATKWKEPALADVIAILKSSGRAKVKTVEDFPPELIAQVKREEQEEAEMLAAWVPEDYENGKAEIIRNEPGMKQMECLPARSAFWIHFLCERYVYGRAMIFSHGVMSEIDRDMYWAKPQPSRGGLLPVPNGKTERVAAQGAKVDLMNLEEET